MLVEVVERHARRWEGAACISYPASWFDGIDTGNLELELSHINSETAKLVCKTCPVRAECLAEALRLGEAAWGVWGGLTRGERRELRP